MANVRCPHHFHTRPYCNMQGASARVDPGVAKWLHVHVRPSVRGLLRMVRAAPSKKGGLLSAVRPLADGHWVLAFPDSTRSQAACALVAARTELMQETYQDLLTRLVSVST